MYLLVDQKVTTRSEQVVNWQGEGLITLPKRLEKAQLPRKCLFRGATVYDLNIHAAFLALGSNIPIWEIYLTFRMLPCLRAGHVKERNQVTVRESCLIRLYATRGAPHTEAYLQGMSWIPTTARWTFGAGCYAADCTEKRRKNTQGCLKFLLHKAYLCKNEAKP